MAQPGFFSVEGDTAARRVGERIVRDLGGQAFTIAAASKPLYHAAALMASPNLTALVDIALEMLSRCGLSANRSRRVLLPLLEEYDRQFDRRRSFARADWNLQARRRSHSPKARRCDFVAEAV